MAFYAIVIGSGFCAAITGCRLSEQEYKVLILERGRRWTRDSYPSETDKDWIWNQECPPPAALRGRIGTLHPT